MAAISVFQRLSAPQLACVDRVIRSYRYVCITDIQAELAKTGLDIKRATLHRYVVKLRERDSASARPEEDTVITIVERSTGQIRVIKTSAAADSVVASIAGG